MRGVEVSWLLLLLLDGVDWVGSDWINGMNTYVHKHTSIHSFYTPKPVPERRRDVGFGPPDHQGLRRVRPGQDGPHGQGQAEVGHLWFWGGGMGRWMGWMDGFGWTRHT